MKQNPKIYHISNERENGILFRFVKGESNLKVICICKEHKKKLKLATGRSLAYYTCPNHFFTYREAGESICNNHVSKKVMTEIKEEVLFLYENNKLRKGSIGLIHAPYYGSVNKRQKGSIVRYTVTDINEDYIEVLVMSQSRLKEKGE